MDASVIFGQVMGGTDQKQIFMGIERVGFHQLQDCFIFRHTRSGTTQGLR